MGAPHMRVRGARRHVHVRVHAASEKVCKTIWRQSGRMALRGSQVVRGRVGRQRAASAAPATGPARASSRHPVPR
eukprot:963366-Prymnesium_polylepis.2